MIYRGESTEAQASAAAGPWARSVVACVLAMGLLGGCSTVSDMFGEDEPAAESAVSTPPEATGDQPFPNLSTVPDEPPPTSSAEERAAILEGLAADRENAEYTDETLGQQATPAPPPAPATSTSPTSTSPTSAPAVASAPAAAAATDEPPAPASAAPAPAAPVAQPPAAPAAQTAVAQTAATQTAAAQTAAAPAAAPPAGTPAPAAPAVQSTPLPAPAAPPAAAQPAPQPAQPAAGFPSAGQQRVLEGGSVIVNPEAALGSGAPVGSRLLPSGESRPVALIFFRYGSAGLSRNDVNVLRDVVRLHRERGGLVRVIGHASQNTGGGDVVKQRLANFNISLARASAVARELSRLGVPIDQVQVAAAGAQQPIYYESTPTGEAGNRRVEIYLDY